MNIKKGFFRLTLILSVLFGILTLIFLNDIFNDSSWLTGGRNIKITIPLPSDWENKTLQQKLNSVDELLLGADKRVSQEYEEKLKAYEDRGKEKRESLVKPSELEEALELYRQRIFPEYRYSNLTSSEQQNVKRRLREEIISDEKKLLKDREKGSYNVFSSLDWREMSFVIFIRFAIGFVSVWLIYAFIRWVVFYFVVGGFKGKSSKGGEAG